MSSEAIEVVVQKQELYRRAIEVSTNALRHERCPETDTLSEVVKKAAAKLKESIESL